MKYYVLVVAFNSSEDKTTSVGAVSSIIYTDTYNNINKVYLFEIRIDKEINMLTSTVQLARVKIQRLRNLNH